MGALHTARDGTMTRSESRLIECMKMVEGTSDKYYTVVEVPGVEEFWLIGYGRNGAEGTWTTVHKDIAKKRMKEKFKKGYKSAVMNKFDRDVLERQVARRLPSDITVTTEAAGHNRFALILSREDDGAEFSQRPPAEDPATWADDW